MREGDRIGAVVAHQISTQKDTAVVQSWHVEQNRMYNGSESEYRRSASARPVDRRANEGATAEDDERRVETSAK